MEEIDYTNLAMLRAKVTQERIYLHGKLKSKYKNLFRMMNVFVAIMLLFNAGALILTNALVYREAPETIVLESNPAASQIHGFEAHPEAKSIFSGFMIQAFFWMLIVLGVFFMKLGCYRYYQLVGSVAILGAMALISGYDFFNNFGYMIGKLIWGM